MSISQNKGFIVNLRAIVDGTDSRAGRAFDFTSQFLILYSLICFSVETLPDHPDRAVHFLKINEVVVVVLFTFEYILRFLAAEKKPKYVFSFYSIIDLVSILPFYIGLNADLRAIRALRFIRLIRLLKLARYGKALERYRAAFKDIKVDLLIFTFITVILLYIAAVGIYHFEHVAQPEVFKSIFDALWWAVATLTTVGYGDIYPITLGGKLFTFVILVLGLGVVAVPTGLIAAALTEARKPSNNSQQPQNTDMRA